MDLWIVISVFGALFQTVRFMLQKVLAGASLKPIGATFARFLYSAPLMATGLLVWFWVSDHPPPTILPPFWAFAVAGGIAQILATLFVVTLFAHRNFAVGLTFAKTEVIMTALLGLALLGDALTRGGWIAILIGVVGVIVLSRAPDALTKASWRDLFTRATALGVGSGALFAVSAVTYRGASMQVMDDSAVVRAAVTLACVTVFQMCVMCLWLMWKDKAEIAAVWSARRTAFWLGMTSLAGSFCWFWAFALQSAAYVKAVGQIELVFGILATTLFFKEHISRREMVGIALLCASILSIVLLG